MQKWKFSLLLCLLLTLNACRTMYSTTLECEQNSKAYNRMLRWQEYDLAETSLVDPALRAEFQKKMTAAKDVRIVDYRVKKLECRPEKGEAEAVVEFDYYIP